MAEAILIELNSRHPEPNRVARVVHLLRQSKIILYPTDSVYAIGCDPLCKPALDDMRRLKPDTTRSYLTLLFPQLADVARYAVLDDTGHRLLKALTPGPFTFILRATKETPRLIQNPRRRTIGVRIPDNAICQAILARLERPLVSSSAPDGADGWTMNKAELFDRLQHDVGVIIDDDESLSITPSTVLDLSEGEPRIVREGLGMKRLAPMIH